jgi:hypothetical protein
MHTSVTGQPNGVKNNQPDKGFQMIGLEPNTTSIVKSIEKKD